MALAVKNPPADAGLIRDTGSIPGLRRAPSRVRHNGSDLACMRVSAHAHTHTHKVNTILEIHSFWVI